MLNEDNMLRVRCNWCESEFDETKILIKDDQEFCPICQRQGFLMDIEEDEGVEGEDFECCDHCGFKENSGHLWVVYIDSQDTYEHWCYDCYSNNAFRCSVCGEAVSLDVPHGEVDEDNWHGICLGCAKKKEE